jgi:predicted MFS family arabinose efflux permease
VPRAVSERTILFLVGAVQFVNVLDFMMVMPLGPDFAVALGIPQSRLGLIGGSYTAAAAVAGIAGATFLDRYDRRRALAVAMLGLVVGTFMGGLATDLTTLVLARVVAGIFGGPATSLALSIVADTIPAERRGKAMGAVMGAFSVASVLGVPAGLELARLGTWRTPFFVVAALGLIIAALAIALMPPIRRHLEDRAARGGVDASTLEILRRPEVLWSLAGSASAMYASFVLIPNLSPFVQHNLGYPRESIGMLYLVGGVVSFASMRVVGPLVDRVGAPRIAAVGTAVMLAVVGLCFATATSYLPVMGMFVGFMIANAFRNVANSTSATKVPAPRERARFMSTQSAVQHIASASGAFTGSVVLSETADHHLVGMPTVALLSMGTAVLLPLFLGRLGGLLRARDDAAPAVSAAPTR